MQNTIADIIASNEMLVLQHKVTPLDKFATNFSGEAIAQTNNGNGARSTIQVDLASGASTTLTKPHQLRARRQHPRSSGSQHERVFPALPHHACRA